jgi:hypothetical protein
MKLGNSIKRQSKWLQNPKVKRYITCSSIQSTLRLFPQPTDGTPDCYGTSSTVMNLQSKQSEPTVQVDTEIIKIQKVKEILLQSVSTSSFHFATILATPNTNSLPLNSILQLWTFYKINNMFMKPAGYVEKHDD